MKRMIFVLIITLIFLFQCSAIASQNFVMGEEEILGIVEIIFKSNFSGNYKSKGYDINYENYELDKVIYNIKNEEWEVRYNLTAEGFYKIFGYASNRYSIWSEEWVSHVSFFVNKNNCEVKSIHVGHVARFISASQENEDQFNCIPNADTALKIADLICRAVFSEIDFELYYPSLGYDFQNDEWIIGYSLKGRIVFGGGGPEIHIKRTNAEITHIWAQL